MIFVENAIVRKLSSSGFIIGLSSLLGIGITYLLAQGAESEELGEYFFLISLLHVLTSLVVFGSRNQMIRQKNRSSEHLMVIIYNLLITQVALIVWSLFGSSIIPIPIEFFVVLVGRALLLYVEQYWVSYEEQLNALALGRLLPLVLQTIGILVMSMWLGLKLSVEGLLLLLFAVQVISALIRFPWDVLNGLSVLKFSTYRANLRLQLADFGNAGVGILNKNSDLLIAGVMLDMTQVAIVGILVRMMGIFRLPLSVGSYVFGPLFSKLYEGKRFNELVERYRKSVLFFLIMAVIGFVVVFSLQHQVMTWFNIEMTVLIYALVLIGESFNLASGNTGTFLNFSGCRHAHFYCSSSVGGLKVVLLLVLTSCMGLIGYAIATMLSSLLLALGKVVLVERRIQFFQESATDI